MTNGRLQHKEELVRLAACDPHLDQAKLNDFLPLTIDGVLVAKGVYALLLEFLQKNSPHNVQKKEGRGVKGFLNNVKKNCTFLTRRLP